jgi:3-deoxy-D-manno-octulosonic-acid transferase
MHSLLLALYSAFMWLAQPVLRAKLARRAQAEPAYGHHLAERFGYYTQAAHWKAVLAADANAMQNTHANDAQAREVNELQATQVSKSQDAQVNAPLAVQVNEPLAEQVNKLLAVRASQGTPVVWLHAVSLGETRAAAILLAQLRSQLPRMRLLLTHSTATGRAEGAKLLQPGDTQAWLPWDTLGATRRFLAHFRPHIGILMETEVWPSLCAQAQRAGVPLVLANARLSVKSLQAAQRVAWLARPAYTSLSQVWAQTDADAQRLAAIGAQHISVQGNLKYDIALDAAQLALGRTWRQAAQRPVIMLASSREGEEALFLQAISALQAAEPAQAAMQNIAHNNLTNSVQWLIVPRHPQRFDEVAALITQAGFSLSRRSQWGLDKVANNNVANSSVNHTRSNTDSSIGILDKNDARLPSAPAAAQIWLGDSLGEMALYYSLSHSALLGGSFAPLGGQNLIEGIAAGCPIVVGPHTFNFADAAASAVEQGAAARVADMPSGLQAALQLTNDAPQHTAMQQAGQHWLATSRGAAQRMAAAVVQVLG